MTGDATPPTETEDPGDDLPSELPGFDGLPDLVNLVQLLSVRPRFGEAPNRNTTAPTTGRHRGIPMVCLVREQNQDALLPHLRLMLHRGAIPCAIHRFPPPPPDAVVDQQERPVDFAQLARIAAVLDDLAGQLSSGINSSSGRVHFRRFDLVHWLMRQRFPIASDAGHQLLGGLRRRELTTKRDRSLRNEEAAAANTPWWIEAVMRFAPPFLFRAKIRGWLPGTGREYRWLPRQRYLAPRDPGTFIGLAERLAGAIPRRPNNPENPEELAKLLVDAFLEDIRQAYRRGPLHPLAGKRTAYTAVLLDNITTTNTGYLLLKLINVVRNDTGAFDPLLVISGSRLVPPDAKGPGTGRPIRQARDARAAYQDWCGQFSGYSRARQPTAWYLPLQVPEPTPSDEFGPLPTLSMAPAPFWSRPSVLTMTAMAAAVGIAAAAFPLVTDFLDERRQVRAEHCGLPTSHPDWDTLRTIDGECIGLSAQRIPQPDSGDEAIEFNKVQDKIAEQNEEAIKRHEADPDRRFATVVFVSGLSDQKETLVSNTERLVGAASIQWRTLDNKSFPLLRILLANAGSRMQHGREFAALLKQLLVKESSVVAVAGLAQSRQNTTDTIQELNGIGLPMVAATLSGDHVAGDARLYFQVSPQNTRQAEVAAGYANTLDVERRVLIVSSSDPQDTYSPNLAEVADRSFQAAGFTVKHLPYDPGSPTGTRDIGTTLCADAGGLVFYAGRPEPFGQILDGINDGCSSDPPRLLAGDDVSRYVADEQLRTTYDIPFDYLSFAVSQPGCEGSSDLDEAMRQLFPEQCLEDTTPSMSGYAALAYDAVNTVVIAIKNSPVDEPQAIHVALEISRLRGDKQVEGESGTIDFGNPLNPNIPKDKFIAVLRVRDRGAPALAVTCGANSAHSHPAAWCPRT